MAVEAVTTNGLPLGTFKKLGIAKMLAPMLDQLNPKLPAFNVQAWTIDTHQSNMIETKQKFSGKMVLIKVDLYMQRKSHFIGINLQAVVDSNLSILTAAVNELHKRATINVDLCTR